MGGYTGKYSRSPFSTYNEEKNYAFALMQEGVPVTDDDENANRLGLFTNVRRGNQLFGNYGTPNDGFRVQEAVSNVNNFKLMGGGVGNTNIEVAGRFFMRGISCILLTDVDYLNSRVTVAEQSIHPRVTNVYFDGSDTVVEDSAANWGTNELQSRWVRINSTDRQITSNGIDFFRISGDHTSGSVDPDPILDLDYYILLLTTPGGVREDAVYLNVYIDEYDADDDPEIGKRIGGTEFVAQLRAKIIQTLFVREDNPTWGDLTDYVDSTGNQHYVFKLATINRDLVDPSEIQQTEISDHVPTIGFTSINQDQLSPLRAAEFTADPTKVSVSPGQCLHSSGSSVVEWAGGQSPAFNPEATYPTNSRYDVLVLDDDGNLQILEGTPAPSPSYPAFYGNPIAFVLIHSASGPAITSSDIVDARTFITPRTSTWQVMSPAAGSLVSQFAAVGIAAGDKVWLPSGVYTIGGELVLDGITLAADRGSVMLTMGATDHIVLGDHGVLTGVRIDLQSSVQTSYHDLVFVSGVNAVVDGIDMYPASASPNQEMRMFGIHVDHAAVDAVVRNCHIEQIAHHSAIRYDAFYETNFVPPDSIVFSTDPLDDLGNGTGSSTKIAQSFQIPAGVNSLAIWMFIPTKALGAPVGAWDVYGELNTDGGGYPSGSVPNTSRDRFHLNTIEWSFGKPLGVAVSDGMYVRIGVPNLLADTTPSTTYWIVLSYNTGTYNVPMSFGGTASTTNGTFMRWNGSAWVPSVGGLGSLAMVFDTFSDDAYENAGCLIENNTIIQEETAGDADDMSRAAAAISVSAPAEFKISPTWGTNYNGIGINEGAKCRIVGNNIRLYPVDGYNMFGCRVGIQYDGSAGLIEGNNITFSAVRPGDSGLFATNGIVVGDWLGSLFTTNVKVVHNVIRGVARGIYIRGVQLSGGLSGGVTNVEIADRFTVADNDISIVTPYNYFATHKPSTGGYSENCSGITVNYGATTCTIHGNTIIVKEDAAAISYTWGINDDNGSTTITENNVDAIAGYASPQCGIISSAYSYIAGNLIGTRGMFQRGIDGGYLLIGNTIYASVYPVMTSAGTKVIGNYIYYVGGTPGVYIMRLGYATNQLVGNHIYARLISGTLTTGSCILQVANDRIALSGNIVEIYTADPSTYRVDYGILFTDSASFCACAGNIVSVNGASPSPIATSPLRFESGCNYNTFASGLLPAAKSDSGTGNLTTGDTIVNSGV